MLYHCDLGIPKQTKTDFGTILLSYTRHALNAASNDRYGQINLPKLLDTKSAKVIEVEVNAGKTTKVVYRIAYNDLQDLVIVVVPEQNIVKTVWLNSKKDLHKTLDASKYSKAI